MILHCVLFCKRKKKKRKDIVFLYCMQFYFVFCAYRQLETVRMFLCFCRIQFFLLLFELFHIGEVHYLRGKGCNNVHLLLMVTLPATGGQ